MTPEERSLKVTKAKKSNGGGRQKVITIVILAIVVIASLVALAASFITDWMWFAEMGYVSVFFKKLVTELEIGVPFFILFLILVDVYLRRLRKKYFDNIESHELTDMTKLSKYTHITAAVFSLILTIMVVPQIWFKLLTFMNSTDFNIQDPLFGLDVSFYVLRLDFLQTLNEMLLGVVMLFILLTLAYYAILMKMRSPDMFEPDYTKNDERTQETGGPQFGSTPDEILENILKGVTKKVDGAKGKVRVDRGNMKGIWAIATGHINVLFVIFFLMLAVNFFLRQFDLLHSHTGIVYGAGFVDVTVRLWAYRILFVLAIASAVIVPLFFKKRDWKKTAALPVIMILVVLLSTGATMLVQNLIVAPDELEKESQYISRNIEFTRYAYDIDDVEVRDFAATNNLTAADIKENAPTIGNIRINDYDPVRTFYNQTQSIRQYYTFNDVDVDRYVINGNLTQTYLSVREIDEEKISDTWLNRHLKYTHGYGVALSKVNTVTANGQPDVLVKNIPPESSVQEISIEQPRIYFGESTNDYSLVNTSEDEFDYPDGTVNQYNKYDGTAGIRMGFFQRLLFAVRERSLKLLVSTNVKSDSRILIYRNIMDRVQRIMPYLAYESDPYAVIDQGRIFWILDAYTLSSKYPYSEPYSGEPDSSNYFRNSVKVVIDAYNGDVSFYVIEEDEPIALTMQKIYPDLFKPYSEMPDGLKSHIRYPDEMLEIQAKIYSRYHMTNERVFYQDEDRWDIANEIYGTKQRAMTPNYYICRLPGESEPEFIDTIAFTPKSKQNMTGLMIARSDGDKYGSLVVYGFPKSKTVYGPMQVEAMIDQNAKISQDFSLWSSAGSNYRRGNMFAIPVNDSLIYVEPIYLEAANAAIPEVKRVVVLYGDRMAYQDTLGDALNQLFGDAGGADTSDDGGEDASTKTQADYIKDAQQAYDNAQEALKEGDWAAYGRYMQQLEESLNKLS